MKNPNVRTYRRARIERGSLLVFWNEDAGKLGSHAARFLNRALPTRELAEINPAPFFPLGGVAVEDDVAQFPESKFYFNKKHKLVILVSSSPAARWYEFLNTALDVAQNCCAVEDVYVFGGMVYLGAHTNPREILAIANSPEMKALLRVHNVGRDLDFETPPGQRPTMSTCLLWVAAKRELKAASLWASVPLYLASSEDPRAVKKVAQFLNHRFNLGLDLKELNLEIERQAEKIARAIDRFPEIDDYIHRLEANLTLSQEENERLVNGIEQFLKGRR